MKFSSFALAPVVLLLVLLTAGCSEKNACTHALDRAPLPFVATALDGNIEYTNPAYQHMLGYTGEELQKMTYQQLTPPKWHDIEKVYIEAADDLPFVRYEKEYITKSGKTIPIEITGWIRRDPNGKPIGTAAFAIDLTQYLREEKLEQMMGLGTE